MNKRTAVKAEFMKQMLGLTDEEVKVLFKNHYVSGTIGELGAVQHEPRTMYGKIGMTGRLIIRFDQTRNQAVEVEAYSIDGRGSWLIANSDGITQKK